MVEITCIYFKPSGKFYVQGSDSFDEALFVDAVYPRDRGQILNEKKLLPGLQSGTWDGPFVIIPADQYPELVTG